MNIFQAWDSNQEEDGDLNFRRIENVHVKSIKKTDLEI
jgi:hypothetical protein